MVLSRRQKLTVILLLIYWPCVFVLAHIPIPQLIYKGGVSDKSIHFIAYLVLVFLLWFTIRPDEKVNWRKATTWWVLLVVVCYGVVDEVLQDYVGRNCDIRDFLSDLAGTFACLILCTFFTFWPVLLVVTGAAIFTLTNLIQANLAGPVPIANVIFRFFGYGFFTALWLQCIHLFLPMKAPKPQWVIMALVLPTVFLLTVELFSVILGKDFIVKDVIISTLGIVTVVAVIYLIALYRMGLSKKDS